jgi:hypothetical protein
VQYLYGASETGLAGPVMIRSINARANETSTNAAKANINLQISLSTTPVTVGTATTTFANNHGTNVSIAYTRKSTSINATTPANPGQYAGALLLDTPFLYHPGQGNLIIDFDSAGQPAGAWTHDTPFTSVGTHASVGAGCGGLTASSTGGGLGGLATFTMAGGQPNGVGLLILGFSLLPAPIPIPGNPGCNLYNDIVVLIVTNLTATGTASVALPVPADASLRGAMVFGQYGAFNAALNVDTAPTRQVTLGGYVVSRIHNTSSNTSPTGTVQSYVGIVLELGL